MKVNQRGEVEYSSFQELAAAYKIKPISKTTKNKEKLKSQQEKFLKHYVCRSCHRPMTYIGDNIMTCTNPECRGIKIEHKNDDGTKSISYLTSFNLLDEKSELVAESIFSVEV